MQNVSFFGPRKGRRAGRRTTRDPERSDDVHVLWSVLVPAVKPPLNDADALLASLP